MPLKTYRQQTKADISGIAVVNFTPPSSYKWGVTQIGVMVVGSVQQSTAQVYVDNNFYCGSNSGNQDAADGTPLIVFDGSVLSVQWANVSHNAECYATLIVQEVAASASLGSS